EEYPDSQPEDADRTVKRLPTSELWGPWYVPPQDSAENRPVAQFKKPGDLTEPPRAVTVDGEGVDPQAVYREHLLPLPSNPSYQGYPSGPVMQPGYPPYSANGFASNAAPYQPYAPYAPYQTYPPPPPRPKRDGYLFGVGIAALVGSSLVLLAGLIALLFFIVLVVAPTSRVPADQQFMLVVSLLAFALIGVIGGSFGLYHSIRSVFLRKLSAGFALPTFWLFVLLYLGVIGAGYALHVQGMDVTNEPLTIFLILMAGLTPALAVLALGNRRLGFPKGASWPTTWRRFALAIVSGATLGIVIAGLLELVFTLVLVRGQNVDPFVCLTNPDAAPCQNPQVYQLLLIAVAVIAPLVEETVKPLAVVLLIGRVRSAAEAFVLGLSCGIGFDLIETSGYISSSYTGWLDTALVRTGAGLLHGLGAAMVALGWYYLTHPGKRRVPKALGCWLYAVAQHAIWNGSWGTLLLSGSVGQFFSNTLTLGSVAIPYYDFINIVEAIIMLAFFLYMTGRLRKTPSPVVEAV
ncbi:MAG TPA: PrsW family glutamic-type intramembrane protease, partial [Ktedonobacteraceae bacterium]|nr:PrsW family glutamic-type intramembrane protease [Ktedonobacteraceae bacterium]